MLPADAGSSALFGNATLTMGILTAAAWDRSQPSAKANAAQSIAIALERALRERSVQDRATSATRFMVRLFDVVRGRMGLTQRRAGEVRYGDRWRWPSRIGHELCACAAEGTSFLS